MLPRREVGFQRVGTDLLLVVVLKLFVVVDDPVLQ
jgi:hypothetical protein